MRIRFSNVFKLFRFYFFNYSDKMKYIKSITDTFATE